MQNGESKSCVAFLWDESFLWGVMAYKALAAGGLSFDLVRSEDIRNGTLKDYAQLFVPGGWASNKLKALGDGGVEEIKRFVRGGGGYLGFCGGAGLATPDGIGLVNVKRKPTKERVPSFSGRIKLATSPHPLWRGVTEPVFHAWWPSQFIVVDRNIKILASYGGALPDSFSSDVNVGDAETAGSWQELERIYRINLDPKRLVHEPAVVEGNFGMGKVLLSLVHFDTPCDIQGATVLKNLWEYLVSGKECGRLRAAPERSAAREKSGPKNPGYETPDPGLISELETAAAGLIALGERNFLWFRRNPMLLQWRRGVRGLEYCTLHIMMKEIAEIMRRRKTEDGQGTDETLERIRGLLIPFVKKAERLLLLERHAMQNGRITYEQCDDPEVQTIREEMFSHSKSHGGMFKKLLDEIDGLLYKILTER